MQAHSSTSTRSQSQSQHRRGAKAVEPAMNDSASAALPLSKEISSCCFDSTPAALCLDDTDSDDSIHQFLMLSSGGSRALRNVAMGGHSSQASSQSRLDDDEDELVMLSATSPYDRPARTRPPSPRRPIAANATLRSIVSVPNTASSEAAVETRRQSKKRQTDGRQKQSLRRLRSAFYSSPLSSSSSSSEDDESRPADVDEARDAVSKRRRMAAPLSDASNLADPATATPLPTKLGRCMSESGDLGRVDNCTRIDKAIASIDSLNLIGNSEQTHSLPTVKSLDFGIRSVTPDTLASLLAGQFADRVATYVVVDCRYPFEFAGGHIRGAENLYRPEVLLDRLLASGCLPSERVVIIFHCEFSSQRAPRMARLLRQRDREINSDNYPQLHYPEIYVLQGGYKAFYEAHKADCEPMGYTKMSDPSYSQQLIHFEKLGRAWERQNSRSKHSRLQRLAALPILT